jgi:hypothetical protein
MPVRSLGIYDVIVDLIPGTTAIILILFPFSPKITTTQGIGILIIGYVVGRIIHATCSITPIKKVRYSLEDHLPRKYANRKKYGLSFRNRLVGNFHEESEEIFDEFEATNQVEDSITRDMIEELSDRVDFEESITEGSININKRDAPESDDGEYEIWDSEQPDDVLSLKHYGENILFRNNLLYGKYEMLSTFYRSVWLVLILMPLFYWGIMLYNYWIQTSISKKLNIFHMSPDAVGTDPILTFLILPILFIICSVICLRQSAKFKFRKSRAFINDLHYELTNDTE